MSDWDPAQYLTFATPRLRPAVDLLARIPRPSPAVVYDLGCGTGNVTRLLAQRWPGARVTGVDSSAAMLTEATRTMSGIRWVEADLRQWATEEPADVVFSNAALHWVDGHATLFPRLVAQLTRGGILAVQMPRNHAAPSHTAMVDAALDGPWRARLEPILRRAPTAPPGVYHDLLAPHVTQLDIWETEYLHVLEGANPVVDWTKGSALRPLLDALDPSDRAAFLAAYASRIASAYPRRSDGRTLFPFRRLFLVATR